MRRREFLALVGGGFASCLRVASAKQPTGPLVGFLSGASRDEYEPYVAAFRDGLQATGFGTGRLPGLSPFKIRPT